MKKNYFPKRKKIVRKVTSLSHLKKISLMSRLIEDNRENLLSASTISCNISQVVSRELYTHERIMAKV